MQCEHTQSCEKSMNDCMKAKLLRSACEMGVHVELFKYVVAEMLQNKIVYKQSFVFL